ncbi:MAG: hypothetical protein ACRBBP_07840 [Bdellovibrionales bacterium]
MRSLNLLFACIFSLILFGCSKGCSVKGDSFKTVVESDSSNESMDSLDEKIGDSEEADVPGL